MPHGRPLGRCTRALLAAIGTMLAGAPCLQRLSLRTSAGIARVPRARIDLGFVQPTSLVLVTFVVVGVGNGLIDVYLNVAAQREESRSRRPVLQWLHASYALGGHTGSRGRSAPDRRSRRRLGLAAAGVALLRDGRMERAASGRRAGRRGRGGAPVRVGPATEPCALDPGAHGPLLLPRGGIDGHLVRSLPSRAARRVRGRGGAAFAAFAGALFVGRLFAAKVLFGLGARRTIIMSGIGGGIGGTIAVLSDTTLVVAAAFLLMGFAISAAGPAGSASWRGRARTHRPRSPPSRRSATVSSGPHYCWDGSRTRSTSAPRWG